MYLSICSHTCVRNVSHTLNVKKIQLKKKKDFSVILSVLLIKLQPFSRDIKFSNRRFSTATTVECTSSIFVHGKTFK